MKQPVCPICGTGTAWVALPLHDNAKRSPERLPMVCARCNSNKASGKVVPIPNGCIPGAMHLAAAIARGVIREYRTSYSMAVEEYAEKGFLGEYFDKFNALYSEIMADMGYYNILTLDKMEGCMSETLRTEDREMVQKAEETALEHPLEDSYVQVIADIKKAIKAVRSGMGWMEDD